MKQLKFMLAAATAIGLATAAQAADQQNPLFTDDFDTRVVNGETLAIAEGTDATDLTGYSYTPEEGGTAADNESVVKAGGYSGNALQINTGTTPLLRDLDSSNSTGISLGDVKSVYIDTMVQFTVTPAGDTVTAGEDDKLMIYLQETNEVTTVDGVDVTNVVNKLMVKAALPATDPLDGTISGAGEAVDVVASAEGLVVLPNTWYNLKVYAKIHLGVPVFTIFIGDTQLKSSQALIDGNDWLFPSLKGPASTSLKYVGFAGEGLVDNLTVATVTEVTAVDFTLTLGTGVSAVTWTINNVTQSGLTGKVTADQTIAITSVTYNDWYCADGTYISGWSGVWGTDVTANITVGAKEVTSADLNVKVPEGTAAETVNAALAWAKAADKSTTDVEGASNLIANYLLNVADLTDEPQIKITGIDLSGDVPTVTAEVTTSAGTTIKTLTADNINAAAAIKYKAAATLEALKAAEAKSAIEAGDQFIQVVVE